MEIYFLALLFCASAPSRVCASPQNGRPVRLPITRSPMDLERRDEVLGVKTCGFLTGDLERPRTAESDFMCVVDPNDKYWGFCRDTATAVADCSLVRACKDSFTCRSPQCGRTDIVTQSVLTCESGNTIKNHCREDLLIAGPSQTYSFMYCAQDYSAFTFSAASEFVTNAPTSPTLTAASTVESSKYSLSPSQTESSYYRATVAPHKSGGSTKRSGAIAGGVVGGLAALIIAAIVFWLLRKRYANKGTEDPLGDLPEYLHTSPKYGNVKTESPPMTEAPKNTPPSELPPAPIEPQELYGDAQQK